MLIVMYIVVCCGFQAFLLILVSKKILTPKTNTV